MRVGANWDQGDFLVDTCTMAGDGDAHVITLQNKNVVYKCGLSLVKTVPVKAYQFSALDHTVVSKVRANILVKSTNFEIQWTVDTSLVLNTLPTEFKATTALNNPILYVDSPVLSGLVTK